jgi:sec-independent protein translocase protein TatB
VFDINPGELVVLLVVAIVVIGPERLPKYAAELGRLVREVRSFARNAREQVRSEMGDEFDDVDWQALDPRRYDPRRIVREALLEDDDEPATRDGGARTKPVERADRAAADGDGDGASGSTAADQTSASPYDDDAT